MPTIKMSLNQTNVPSIDA